MNPREITPVELQQMLSTADPVTLIDVREPQEAAVCTIEGSTLIPLNSLPQRLQEIPAERPVVLYCHHGMRSMHAARFLARNGYDAISLAGGIDRWAVEIDRNMARY